jgi:hypothetical protein
VVALAGRRIDPLDAPAPRFPLANAPIVRRRIEAALKAAGARTLICAPACGADLLALEAAAALGLRRIVVLPLPAEEFRAVSVADRPGDWGPRFDQVMAEVTAAGDLVVLAPGAPDRAAACRAANEVIIRDAFRLSGSDGAVGSPLAVIVWDGAAHSGSDLSAHFCATAERLGAPLWTVSTL